MGWCFVLRWAIFGMAVLVGCNQDIKTPFPEGLEPLEKNKASWPSGSGFPESLSCVDGTDEDETVGEYTWVHCKTYVQAPVADVYDALLTPRVVADRRALDQLSVEWDVEPDYDHSFLLHNTVLDIITVEFDVNWRHGATDGNTNNPQEIGSRWQKTYGSEVIELLRGSMVTAAENDNNTGIEIILHQKSLQSDQPLMMQYIEDLQADILAFTRGEELPAYDGGV